MPRHWISVNAQSAAESPPPALPRTSIPHPLLPAAGPARARQASKIVRDAITMILEGTDQFTSGYNKGLRDAMDLIHKDDLAGTVSVNDKRIADHLIDQIEGLIND